MWTLILTLVLWREQSTIIAIDGFYLREICTKAGDQWLEEQKYGYASAVCVKKLDD